MGKLIADEIYVGLVYSFVSKILVVDGSVSNVVINSTDSVGERPFVCLSNIGSECYWAEITKQDRTDDHGNELRLLIKPEWKRTENNFSNKWIKDSQYINGCLYKGPSLSFCSAGNDILELGKRRFVTSDGVEAIKCFFKLNKMICIP